MDFEIFTAETEEDYQEFGRLIADYVDWCRRRHHDQPDVVDKVFGHQALDDELKIISTSYGPPDSKTLLVRRQGKIVGGGAYRRLDNEICELKRVYIDEGQQGIGIGRALCLALMNSAKEEGFRIVRLDTGKRLTEAISLYESLGFRHIESYHEYPEEFLNYMYFMERPL